MLRLFQREMDLRPGDGPPVVLVDCTGSVPYEAKQRMEEALGRFREIIPTMRVFGFAKGVVEITLRQPYGDGSYSDGILPAIPPDGFRNDRERYANSRPVNATYLGLSLQAIEHLRPSLVIIMSDGGSADKWRACRVADRLGCPIDCYFFRARECDRSSEDPHHLAELARRSRGRYADLVEGHTITSELTRSLAPSIPQQRNEDAMSGYRTPSSKLNIQMPGEQVHRVTEVIHVVKDREIHLYDGETRYIDHGSAHEALLQIGATEVSVDQSAAPVLQDHRPPRSRFAEFFLGARREEDRGAIAEQPKPAELEPPRAAPLALSFFTSKQKVRS